MWAHTRLLVTKHHLCESSSLLCGAAFLCMSEDVVNLLAGLGVLPYRHSLSAGKLVCVCVCVWVCVSGCIQEGFLLCTVCRLHRLWLNVEHRAGSALVSAKAGALEEAEGEGCGTGARAKRFLWYFSVSLLFRWWSTWMAGFSAIEAENHHTHTHAHARTMTVTLTKANARFVTRPLRDTSETVIYLKQTLGLLP